MDENNKKRGYLEVLLRSHGTIFTTKEVALHWREDRPKIVSLRLDKYTRTGKLIRLRRGIYAKDVHYDRLELATRIYTPAYISFETVLAQAGVIFQFYSQIFIASYVSRDVTIEGQTYTFKKIKDTLLINEAGIERRGTYFIASPERAFLDVIYLNTDYHFDNLGGLRWDVVENILPIYKNKRMEGAVARYRQRAHDELE